ncbi:MAG: sugar porter family MFS transporter [Cyclonatronaceae bacterium]
MGHTQQEESYNLPRIILLSLTAALGGFLFGFDSGVINGTVEALQVSFNSDAVGTGFNVASMLLGCAAGAFFAGTLADKFGRKPVLLITAAMFILSAWGSGIAASSPQFVFFRIIGGLAVGAASILTPAYISEIAPSAIRGRLATLQQLMIVVGLFMAFLSNYLIAGAAGGALGTFWAGFQGWQWMFWVEILPASLFLGGLLFIPESPRYLVAVGKEEQAASVLSGLGNNRFTEKVAEIKHSLRRDEKPGLSALVSKRGGLHPVVWVGIGLAVLQQFTGINVVFYYGSTLWQAAGFTEENALLQNVISGTVNVSFTFLAIMLIDKVGRKPLLMLGALGQAVMLGALALLFGTGELSPDGNLLLSDTNGVLALISANAYIAFFAFTWGPIMWVMLGEMFPNRIRGAALGLCGLIHWTSNFSITMTFPILLAGLGLSVSYGIYAFFGFVAYFFVKNLLQETKGRSLEDMDEG